MQTISLLVALLAFLSQPIWGQAPSAVPQKGGDQKKQSAPKAQEPKADNRGTKESPPVVDIQGHQKSTSEPDNPDSYFDALISPNNLPNVILAAVGIVGIVVAINTLIWLKRQTVAIRKQADIMEKQASDGKDAAEQQAKNIEASIAEAVRSSAAMERVAESMAVNATSVRESVGISREIADMQKKAVELGGRAYLSVSFEGAIYQDANNFFEARAMIKNHGNTPAYDVRFNAVAGIINDPIPGDFDYPLPKESAGTSVSLLWPQATKSFFRLVTPRVPEEEVELTKFGGSKWLALWGVIDYRDAFDVERSTRFAFTVRWLPVAPGAKDVNGNPLQRLVMSYDTAHHNEAN